MKKGTANAAYIHFCSTFQYYFLIYQYFASSGSRRSPPMPTCNYCGNEYTPKAPNQATCGADSCRKRHNSERNNAWRKAREEATGKHFKFSLGFCPWETGQLKPSGREPDFGLGF